MQEEVLKYAKESTMISLNYSLSLLKQSVEDFVKEFDNRLDVIQKVGGDLDLSEKQHLMEQKSLLEAVELSDISASYTTDKALKDLCQLVPPLNELTDWAKSNLVELGNALKTLGDAELEEICKDVMKEIKKFNKPVSDLLDEIAFITEKLKRAKLLVA